MIYLDIPKGFVAQFPAFDSAEWDEEGIVDDCGIEGRRIDESELSLAGSAIEVWRHRKQRD